MNPTTKEGIDRFAEHGQRPGGFLYAVLTNNLMESFGRADLENRNNMFEIVSYCYNEIAGDCWGSKEKVQAWIDKKQKYNKSKDILCRHVKGMIKTVTEAEPGEPSLQEQLDSMTTLMQDYAAFSMSSHEVAELYSKWKNREIST